MMLNIEKYSKELARKKMTYRKQRHLMLLSFALCFEILFL